MVEIQIVQENKTNSSLIKTLLKSILFLTIILGIVAFLIFLYIGIESTKGTDPKEVFNHTSSQFLIMPYPQRTFDEFYSSLNNQSKNINTSKLDNLGLPKLEYTNEFYNFKSEYYDSCESKKVKLNFSNKKTSKLSFNYKTNKIMFSVDLYNDLYKFTDKLKTQDCYFRKDKYVKGYFEDPYNTEFMNKISEDFLSLKEKYSDDELVEIATIFAQSIKYGTDKTNLNRYPYETFYEEEGNCLDKTVILAFFLKKLGYTTYILLGQSNEYHSLVGIVCDKGNAEIKGNKICFIETTTFAPIGTKVDIDVDKIVIINNGNKIYHGDSYGPKTVEIIKQKNQKIDEIEFQINQSKDNLLTIQKEMCSTDCAICYNNKTVNFDKTNKEISSCYDASYYNVLVEEYNKQVNEYNNLIKEIYYLYYEIEELMFENIELVKRG